MGICEFMGEYPMLSFKTRIKLIWLSGKCFFFFNVGKLKGNLVLNFKSLDRIRTILWIS